jgi:phage tail protein X
MIYKALQGEFIYDVAVKLYGDLVLGIDQILKFNTGLDLGDDLQGVDIVYSLLPKRRRPVFVSQSREVKESYSTRYYQSVYDISTQLYGDLSGLVEVFKNHTDLDSLVTVGTVYEAGKSQDPRVKYFKERSIIIQTDIMPENTNFILREDLSLILREDGNFISRE